MGRLVSHRQCRFKGWGRCELHPSFSSFNPMLQDLIDRVKVNTRHPSVVFRNIIKLSRGEYIASKEIKNIHAACLFA